METVLWRHVFSTRGGAAGFIGSCNTSPGLRAIAKVTQSAGR
jgi:hypothetical protein